MANAQSPPTDLDLNEIGEAFGGGFGGGERGQGGGFRGGRGGDRGFRGGAGRGPGFGRGGERPDFIDSACSVETSSCGLLDCGNADAVFVCRSPPISPEMPNMPEMVEPEPKTICIPKNRGLERDACGCCEEPFPTACTCSCDVADPMGFMILGSGGALVDLVPPPMSNRTETRQVCVSPGQSINMVSMGRRATCAECAV